MDYAELESLTCDANGEACTEPSTRAPTVDTGTVPQDNSTVPKDKGTVPEDQDHPQHLPDDLGPGTEGPLGIDQLPDEYDDLFVDYPIEEGARDHGANPDQTPDSHPLTQRPQSSPQLSTSSADDGQSSQNHSLDINAQQSPHTNAALPLVGESNLLLNRIYSFS